MFDVTTSMKGGFGSNGRGLGPTSTPVKLGNLLIG